MSADNTFNGPKAVSVLKSAYDNWMVTLEIIEYQAKTIKARYDAAIAQGFSEEQALQLCVHRWEV